MGSDPHAVADGRDKRALNEKTTANGELDKSAISNDNGVLAQYTKDPSSPVERVKFIGIGDKDSICSDDEDTELPPIPDGGWGWVVVFSAFLVSACADGLAFSFSLLEIEFKNHFNTTESKAALIGGFFIATPLLAGPIMSALVDRFGCQVMTIIAGIVSTIGFLLAAVSNSIALLCLTYGFISGLAMGVLYVTAVVSVAFWFDKRRNLAVSLASCGIGFGTFVYPKLTEYFIQSYGWRGAVILLGATLLNMCVCGALMRNPEWLEIKQKTERKLRKARSRKSSSAGSISSRSLNGDSTYLGADELKTLLESGQSPEYILATLASSIEEAEQLEATTQANAEAAYKRMHSAINLPTFIQQNEKVPPEVIEKLMENKRIYNILLQNYPHVINRRKSEVNVNVEKPPSDAPPLPIQLPVEINAKKPKVTSESAQTKTGEPNNETGDMKKNEATPANTNVEHPPKTKQTSNAPPQQMNWLRQISTTDHHYLKDMPLYKSTMMHRGAMLSITRYKLKISSLPDIYRNSSWSIDSESDDEWRWYNRAWTVIKNTFDFKMFTELHFLLFNLSSLLLSIWFIMPYFFLPHYMEENGVSDGPVMITIIGVASSIGIVTLGWAGDQPWINVTKTYAACLIICGVSIALYPPFITNYWAIAVISAIFGLSFASSYSYTPPILMELMPIDRFSVAYGLILLSQGVGHLAGPSIGGLLREISGNWNLTFYLAGISVALSGILVGAIAYTRDVRLCGTAPLLKEAEEANSIKANV